MRRKIVPVPVGFSKLFIAVGISFLSLSLFAISPLPAPTHEAHAAATPTFVQKKEKQITSGTINSTAFNSANAASNLIVVYVVWDNGGAVTLSDSRGNTYASAVGPTKHSANVARAQIFYAKNIVAGSNTVTATFITPITSFGRVYIHEYSGLDTVSPVDVVTAGAGSASAMTSGSVTTGNPTDLLFGAGESSNNVTAAGANYTTRSTAFKGRTEDRVVTSTASYTATATQNGNSWVMQMVAFKAAIPDTTPPSVPGGLSATAVSPSQINLSWSASTDNVGVTGYKIFRSGLQIATSTLTSYQNTGLTASTTYTYTVSAFDAAGNNSAQSASASATTQAAPPLTPAVAYALNEGVGTSTIDSSGNNLTGTVTGATWVPGKYGTGLSMNGANNQVSRTNVTLPTAFTMMAWINEPSFVNYESIIAVGTTRELFLRSTGQMSFYNGSASANGPTVAAGGWHHVAATSDGATVKFYVDGVQQGGNQALSMPSGVTATFQVGAWTTTDFFSGTIDEPQVFNRVLTQTEIQTAMNTPLGGTPPPPDTTEPSTPTGLSASAVSANRVNLTWTASIDNIAVTGYKVFRDTLLVGTSNLTSFNDMGLTASTTYIYNVSAFDAAGNNSGQSTSASATTPLQAPGIAWPLRLSQAGKYLESQSGVPFLVTADAGWELTTQISQEDAITYLDDRLAKGFNAVEIRVIGSHFQDNDPNNFYNEPPFTNGPSDWSVRNPAYWTRIDSILTAAKDRGMIMLMFPAYMGFACGNQGWCQQMLAQSDAAMTSYGQWIGDRYKDYGNIIWMTGGDLDVSQFGSAQSRNAAVVGGIRSADTDAIFSVEPDRGQIGGVDSYATLVDINAVYSGTNPASMVGSAYGNVRPFIFQEGYYENEHSTTLADQEAQALITYLGGGLVGYTLGTCPLWSFGAVTSFCDSTSAPFNTWQNNLNSPASVAVGNIGKLMRSRKWWAMVPDYANTVVTSAKGSEFVYHATAREAVGQTVMVWSPNTNQVTVNMTKIAGSVVNAWWHNPDDGASVFIGTFANTGTRVFTPASARKVLVLDDASLNLPAPGTSVYGQMIIPDTTSPSIPTNLTANAVASNQINLSWTASTDNVGVTGYKVFRDAVMIATTTAVSYQDTSVVQSTTYTYTVSAYDAAGNVSALSSSAGATTPTPDTIPPTVPTGLASSNITSNSFTLLWTASTDNVAVAGYYIYRNAIVIASTSLTSYQSAGLSPSTTYTYTVTAFDASNNFSPQSNALLVTTLSAPAGVPTFVQQNYATPQTSQSQVAVSYPSSETMGNTNIVAIGWNDVTSNIASVVDTQGNTYTVAVPTVHGNGLSQAIYYAKNIIGGSNTVTITFTQAVPFADVRVTEYSHIAQISPFDAGTSATGNSSAANSAAITTTVANDLIFGAGMTGGSGFTSAGSGFTSRVITAPDGDIIEDRLGVSAGSYSATASLSSATWLMQVAAFKAGN